MRRRLMVALAMLVLVATASGVSGQTGSNAGRQIAIVVDLWTPPLFAPDGEHDDAAEFNVDTFLRRVQVLGDIDDIPFAISIPGVVCDELRLIGSERARRALDVIEQIAASRPVLRTTYASARLDQLSGAELAAQLEDSARVVERCTGRQPRDPFVPATLSIPDPDPLERLREEGVRSALSAKAVPPAEQRPRILPAHLAVTPDTDELSTVRPETSSLVVVVPLEAQAVIAAAAADERLDVVGIDDLGDLDVIGGVIEDAAPRPLAPGLDEAAEALGVFHDYTLADNRLGEIFDTILARTRGTPAGGGTANGGRARQLLEALERERDLISVSDGSVTFTSRRGAVPITISNRASYPVRVRVSLSSPKLDFADGASDVVEVEPPGDTVTFEALARSSGTFPTTVEVGVERHDLVFDEAKIDVRSTAANVSALVLTAGGALFLAYWLVRRIRRVGFRIRPKAAP